MLLEAWDWIQTHWAGILIAGLVAVQLINRVTARWDEIDGPTWKRVLLLYTELASIVVSRGRAGFLGWLKLPGNPFGGKSRSLFPPAGKVTIVLICALCACAPSWRKQADQSIAITHKAAASSWNAARILLHNRCMDAIEQCKASGLFEPCPALEKCQRLRRDLETALIGTQEMLAQAADALKAYDALAQGGASGAELDAKAAEARERINRAQRQSAAFLERVKAEGLSHHDESRTGGQHAQ